MRTSRIIGEFLGRESPSRSCLSSLLNLSNLSTQQELGFAWPGQRSSRRHGSDSSTLLHVTSTQLTFLTHAHMHINQMHNVAAHSTPEIEGASKACRELAQQVSVEGLEGCAIVLLKLSDRISKTSSKDVEATSLAVRAVQGMLNVRGMVTQAQTLDDVWDEATGGGTRKARNNTDIFSMSLLEANNGRSGRLWRPLLAHSRELVEGCSDGRVARGSVSVSCSVPGRGKTKEVVASRGRSNSSCSSMRRRSRAADHSDALSVVVGAPPCGIIWHGQMDGIRGRSKTIETSGSRARTAVHKWKIHDESEADGHNSSSCSSPCSPGSYSAHAQSPLQHTLASEGRKVSTLVGWEVVTAYALLEPTFALRCVL